MKASANTTRLNWAGQAPLITLIVLCVVTALLTNRFLSPLNLTNILVQSSIMAVIAMGMTFVIVGGGFDLSVGSTVALSGCIAGMVMLKFGILAGVVAGIAAGAAVGLANGLVVAMLRVNPFIATLGSMVLIRGVVYIITAGAPVAGEDGLPSAFIAFGNSRLLGIHYLVWVPALLLDALRPARLRDWRQQGGGLSLGRRRRPCRRLDLCLVRRAGRRRRRHARGAVAVRPANRG
jgi:ribose/xylose/arabinose/galactoside ABC-type transport system permease subunit